MGSWLRSLSCLKHGRKASGLKEIKTRHRSRQKLTLILERPLITTIVIVNAIHTHGSLLQVNLPEIAEHPIELEHVFATFLALLYVPAEMSEFPKVDQTTLMDHSTTHTKLVQHPAKILMSAEMTTEDTTEMETIPTADKIPDSMPIGLLSLLGLTGQSSQAGPIGLLEALLAAPLAVPAPPSVDLSGKVGPDPDNLWMIFLTENHLIIMPLLLLELSK